MRGYGRILVPLDLSDMNRRILDAAVRVVGEGGELHLLHVVEWLPSVTESTFGVYAHRKDIDKIKAAAAQKLAVVARAHAPIKCEIHVHEGKPAATILEAAAELRPDLVVMGTHSRSRLDQFLVGSVAEKVLRKVESSVLLVRFGRDAD